jgi:RNA polymerase sigma factor (sigma-70 family)
VNLAKPHFRRARVERAYLRRQSEDPMPPGGAPDLATREAMRFALLRLPPRQRAAIVLRFYEDLSKRRTAELLGCRPGTVKSLVSQGAGSPAQVHPPRAELDEEQDVDRL